MQHYVFDACPPLRRRASATVRLAFIMALTAIVSVRPAHAATVANYQFGAGWATFGLALPQGAAPSTVQVGTLATQTDVKTRWPDGSLRFAVVTANIPSSGTYAIGTGTQASGSFTPVWPAARVTFTIGGVAYSADLPAFNAADGWLAGALVREARVVVVPTAVAGAHPLLQVIFDVRSYATGGHRLDVTVQNVRDISAMDKVTYDLTVTINGTSVYTKPAVTQYSYTRWRKTFNTSLTEASVVPDFEPFFASAALPRFLSTVMDGAYDTSGAAWDINQFATMTPDQGAPGYRPELSPFTEWQARYLAHKGPTQRQAVLLTGNNSGSWSMHIAKPDGVSMIKVTDPGSELYWFDVGHRYGAGLGPAVPARADGAMRGIRSGAGQGLSDVDSNGDHEHVPNLTYLPYMVTGDRYYLDQLKLWASWSVLNVWPLDPAYAEPVFEPLFNRSRSGSKGLLWGPGLTRELGHPMLLVVEAAAAIPDADGDKGYFKTIIQNQLDALGDYVTRTALPGGAVEAMGWETWATKSNDTGADTGRYFSLWRLSYTAFAVDFADQQKLWSVGSAAEFRNRVVRGQAGFINNGVALGVPAGQMVPYYPAVAKIVNGTLQFFNTWAELFAANTTFNFQGTSHAPGWDQFAGASFVGYNEVEAFITLSIGNRLGIPGAASAFQWLSNYPGVLGDLNYRSGYAVSYTPSTSTGTPPAAPGNLSYIPSGATVTLSWTPSAGATSYDVEVGSQSGSHDLLTVTTPSPVLMTPVGTLGYFVRIRARSTDGVSGPSNELAIPAASSAGP